MVNETLQTTSGLSQAELEGQTVTELPRRELLATVSLSALGLLNASTSASVSASALGIVSLSIT